MKVDQSFLETLLLVVIGIANIIITATVLPRITDRYAAQNFFRQRFYEESATLLNFITGASTSGKSWGEENIPAKYREICLQIHLLFPTGKAPEPLNSYLEDVFQIFHKANHSTKTINAEDKVLVQKLVQKIRKELSGFLLTSTKRAKSRKYKHVELAISDFSCANNLKCRYCTERIGCSARQALIRLNANDEVVFGEFSKGKNNVSIFVAYLNKKTLLTAQKMQEIITKPELP